MDVLSKYHENLAVADVDMLRAFWPAGGYTWSQEETLILDAVDFDVHTSLQSGQ